MDRRVTLKDIGINKLQLGNKIIRLYEEDDWVGRGGTCLVYNGYIQDTDVDGNKLENRIVLKEFYPLLSDDELVSIERDSDGRVIIPEVSINSMEYSKKKRRFEESNDRFKYFHSQKETNNYVVKSMEMIEANGTLYIIMDYDNAEGMDKFILSKPSIYNFFVVLKKAAEAINSFHKLGYIHLDVTPSNLLYFDTHTYVSVMDTDSIINKDDVDISVLSYSSGYTAPEILERDTWVLKDCGEKADVFSIGAITYRFFMDEILDYMTDDNKIDKGRIKELLYNYTYERQIENKIYEKYSMCSRYAIDLIKNFLRNTLSYNVDDRYKDMDEIIADISNIIKHVDEKDMTVQENFAHNQGKIFGRDSKVSEIEKKFSEQQSRGKSRLLFINGIGGIGKSSLARLYAQKHEKEYTSIIEIHATSAREAIVNTKVINENIIIKDSDGKIIENKEVTEQYYKEKKELLNKIISKSKNKVLYIVHDYNVMEDAYFSDWNSLGCDILLTSWNDWSKSGVPVINLKSVDFENGKENKAALNIFKYYYKETATKSKDEIWINSLEEIENKEEEEIKELVSLVGYHPLCIKVIAKQMSYLKGMEMRPSEMIKELKEQGIKPHMYEKVHNKRDEHIAYGDAYYHLQCVFCTVRSLGRLDEDEKEALRIMTLVPSETGISMTRFVNWSGMGRKAVFLLQQLQDKGWLEYASDKEDLLDDSEGKSKGVFYLPMVSSEVLCGQEGMESNCDNCEEFINKCDSMFKCFEFSYIGNIYTSQTTKILKVIKEEENIKYADMIFRLSHFICNNDKALKKAIKYQEKALKIRKKELGENHGDTVLSYDCLAMLYWEMGNKEKGVMHAEKALEITKKLGESQKNIAIRYDLIAKLYWKIGNEEKGLMYLEKALEIKKKALGENHKDVVYSYELIGMLYEEIGRKEKGLEYQEKALEIRKKESGENNIDIATLYDNIGVLYEEMGYKEKGLEYQEKALEIRKKELGENDIYTAESYDNVGVSYWILGNKEKGLEYLERALEVRIEELREDHKDIAASYNNLGVVYWILGDKEKGLEYLEKALEIRIRELGENHGDTALSYENVGSAYQRMGAKEKGLEYLEKAIEIRIRALGEEGKMYKKTIGMPQKDKRNIREIDINLGRLIFGQEIEELELEKKLRDIEMEDIEMTECEELNEYIRIYLKKIGELPLMSQEEEGELAKRMANGDNIARSKLIEANLKLVVSVSKRYSGKGVIFLDLVKEGYIALVKGVENFDYKKGCRLSESVIWGIRRAIENVIYNQMRKINIPSNKLDKIHELERVKEELIQELGREPDVAELAFCINLSELETRELLEML